MTNDDLKKIINTNFANHNFILASYREPISHFLTKDNKIETEPAIGGVSITSDSLMRITKGCWVAFGGGSADKQTVDKNDHFKVTGSGSSYTLRRIWATPTEFKNYYGFANQALWPLCHAVFKWPVFDQNEWEDYKKVNKRFADAILDEINGKKSVVWIQDYQLALVAKYIKDKRPDVTVAHFWHIPWPTYEIFRICPWPWKHEILASLLSCDLLGFQRNYHQENFYNTVSREIECKINREDSIVEFKRHKARIGIYPISIDNFEVEDKLKRLKNDQAVLKKYVDFPCPILALGVDRVDYTKGITARLRAIEYLLDSKAEYHQKFVYLGIAAPSRTGIPAYEEYNQEIRELVQRINGKYATKNWKPIVYSNKSSSRDDVLQLCRLADLCLVTSLDDGMNLVSKEYVSANNGNGALVLSAFAGSARELTESYFVNPYDIYEISRKIEEALLTSLPKRKERMAIMKKAVKDNNIFKWAADFLLDLAKIKGNSA